MSWKQREKLGSTQLSTYSRPSGSDAAAVAQAPVDRDHVVVAETLDHHEQHFVALARRRPADLRHGRGGGG